MSNQGGSELKCYQQSLPDAFHNLSLDAGFTQDVVWSDAGLTTVGKLSPCDTTVNEPQAEALFNTVDHNEH